MTELDDKIASAYSDLLMSQGDDDLDPSDHAQDLRRLIEDIKQQGERRLSAKALAKRINDRVLRDDVQFAVDGLQMPTTRAAGVRELLALRPWFIVSDVIVGVCTGVLHTPYQDLLVLCLINCPPDKLRGCLKDLDLTLHVGPVIDSYLREPFRLFAASDVIDSDVFVGFPRPMTIHQADVALWLLFQVADCLGTLLTEPLLRLVAPIVNDGGKLANGPTRQVAAALLTALVQLNPAANVVKVCQALRLCDGVADECLDLLILLTGFPEGVRTLGPQLEPLIRHVVAQIDRPDNYVNDGSVHDLENRKLGKQLALLVNLVDRFPAHRPVVISCLSLERISLLLLESSQSTQSSVGEKTCLLMGFAFEHVARDHLGCAAIGRILHGCRQFVQAHGADMDPEDLLNLERMVHNLQK
jgi:hypothetical protein